MDTIDTTFDVRTDAGGKDPDTYSATLRRYHRLLWSKPLPNGAHFLLEEHGKYLRSTSPPGDLVLSSDSVMQTFVRWPAMQHITSQCTQQENDEFMRLGYTIGGMMVFPATQVAGQQTINAARGCNKKISDRFDLTLECIRRHYLGDTSPLAKTLARYHDFFALFDEFAGYVEFFLLQDLVTSDYQGVRFFIPLEDFSRPAVPHDIALYREFRQRSIDFIQARNRRIDQATAFALQPAALR
jgi:hypothetical protein